MKTLMVLALFAMVTLTSAETRSQSMTPGGQIVSSDQSEPAALKQPVLFWAKWCPYCRAAEAYLLEKNVSFQKQDVDTPEGKRALLETGGRSIPVLLIDGREIRGFSRATYDTVFGGR